MTQRVAVRSDGVSVAPLAADAVADVGLVEARRRFGGLDVPATWAGALAGLGTGVIPALALYQRDRVIQAAGGIVVAALAALLGGWVAGRMARYDGARNGLLMAVWFLGLAVAAVIAAGEVNDIKDVFSPLTAAVLGAVTLLTGCAGGWLGERWHRRPDALIARTRTGGVSVPQHVVRSQ